MSHNPTQDFEERIAETQSGATEVQDFALKTSYAFPSADVLVPAPMTVSILGQLTLVAATRDFKLVKPINGFKHIQYPNSFRATIMQLVNSGCFALNQSFFNFDEIKKRCAAVRPGVNNIVQLLVGHEDNTPHQNEMAIERHLPNQIEALRKTIRVCLRKAKETDSTFNQLLQLTAEIHESCTATQGETERKIKEADIRNAYLEKEQEAAAEMKRIGEESIQKAREDFANAQKQFNNAAESMHSGRTLNGLHLVNMLTSAANVLTLGLLKKRKGSMPNSGIKTSIEVEPVEPTADKSHVYDPGYEKASVLRNLTEILYTLLTSGDDGLPDWNEIESCDMGGFTGLRIGFEQIINGVEPNRVGGATAEVIRLARNGTKYARKLSNIVPPGNPEDLRRLIEDASAWREKVLAFASEADLKLGSALISPNVFLPKQNFDFVSGTSRAELAIRSAQYRLAVTQAQLNASRESSKIASDKLMQVNSQLRMILAHIAKIDAPKQNWKEITEILLKAVGFLCELKKYLNNLVHFFGAVHNLVSVTLKEAADQFIQIVKDSSAIKNGPSEAGVKNFDGVTLDAWARQAIYNHALSAAKISRVVENISDMYVTLYDSNVHPGVNMLHVMGKLVVSKDKTAIAKAGKEIQDWAQGASDRIIELVAERTRANERDIQNRMMELERSLGEIVPKSSRIEEIVRKAETAELEETKRDMGDAVKENPVFQKRARAFV